MTSKLAVAAGLAALITAGAGSAATVEYHLQGNSSTNYNWLSPSHTDTQQGLTATFTAGAFTSVAFSGNSITAAAFTNAARIGLYPGGAGVTNSSTDDSHTVDGGGYKDFIQISFAEAVKLTEISFGYYSSDDHFRWMYDSSGDGVLGIGDYISDAFSVGANNPFAGFGGVSSTLFAVGAFDDYETCYKNGKRGKKQGYDCRIDDSWKLRGATVELPEHEDPNVVPLPAAGWLLVAGLGGLAALRRRA